MTRRERIDRLKYKLLERSIINDPDIFVESYLLGNEMVVDTVTVYGEDAIAKVDPELMITVKKPDREVVVFEQDPTGIDILKDLLKGTDLERLTDNAYVGWEDVIQG